MSRPYREIVLVDGHPLRANHILACFSEGSFTLRITDAAGTHELPAEFVGGRINKHGEDFTCFQLWRTPGSGWVYPSLDRAVQEGEECMPGVYIIKEQRQDSSG